MTFSFVCSRMTLEKSLLLGSSLYQNFRFQIFQKNNVKILNFNFGSAVSDHPLLLVRMILRTPGKHVFRFASFLNLTFYLFTSDLFSFLILPHKTVPSTTIPIAIEYWNVLLAA